MTNSEQQLAAKLDGRKGAGHTMRDASGAGMGGEVRIGVDRRKRPTPFLSRYTLVGRRKANRRAEDGLTNYYADRLQPRTWLFFWIIAGLSLLDMIFSIHYLSRGYVEANPLLRLSLFFGAKSFIFIKLLLTALGLFIICMHQYFRYIYAVIALFIIFYAVLDAYHIALLWR